MFVYIRQSLSMAACVVSVTYNFGLASLHTADHDQTARLLFTSESQRQTLTTTFVSTVCKRVRQHKGRHEANRNVRDCR
jgi:ERCC4-type nuclease